jgi:predicted N-formylglutamate amidohydrolase
LLGATDPSPVRVERRDGPLRVLVVADHAGRAFPARLERLGLPIEATWRHIAWDLGAGDLAAALGVRWHCSTIRATYSRLVVDCNRHIDDPSAFSIRGDGHRVPGNEGLSDADRRARVEACHTPYHAAIEAHLDRLTAEGPTALVAIHSFVPVLGRHPRPWNAGVLWDGDDRVARPLLTTLRREPGLLVGDNEPYSGRYPADYTMHRHGAARGLAHVCIEVRQDELLTPRGVDAWANRLAAALEPILRSLGCSSGGAAK